MVKHVNTMPNLYVYIIDVSHNSATHITPFMLNTHSYSLSIDFDLVEHFSLPSKYLCKQFSVFNLYKMTIHKQMFFTHFLLSVRIYCLFK